MDDHDLNTNQKKIKEITLKDGTAPPTSSYTIIGAGNRPCYKEPRPPKIFCEGGKEYYRKIMSHVIQRLYLDANINPTPPLLLKLIHPVLFNTGTVVTNTDEFISEIHLADFKTAFSGLLPSKRTVTASRETYEIKFSNKDHVGILDGDYLNLNIRNAWNYFHFIFDGIASLWFLDTLVRAADVKVIVPSILRPIHLEILRKIGFEDSQFVVVKQQDQFPVRFRVSNLLCSWPHGGYHNHSSQEKYTTLKRLLKIDTNKKRGNDLKICISVRKSGSTGRRVDNQTEIYLRLCTEFSRENVLEVDFSDMSFDDQRNLNADVLIGVHGAGLTNCIFMQPGGLVIELSRFEWNPVYYEVSEISSLTYVAIFPKCEIYENDPHGNWPSSMQFNPDTIIEAITWHLGNH